MILQVGNPCDHFCLVALSGFSWEMVKSPDPKMKGIFPTPLSFLGRSSFVPVLYDSRSFRNENMWILKMCHRIVVIKLNQTKIRTPKKTSVVRSNLEESEVNQTLFPRWKARNYKKNHHFYVIIHFSKLCWNLHREGHLKSSSIHNWAT